ncbi:hypothetical protein BST61_g4453 [Cercospora zeina]
MRDARRAQNTLYAGKCPFPAFSYSAESALPEARSSKQQQRYGSAMCKDELPCPLAQPQRVIWRNNLEIVMTRTTFSNK